VPTTADQHRVDRPQLHDSALLRACRREPVPYTPVWFMRQAGRSLPEYRALRESTSMLDACTEPDLVVEITMQPVRRYAVDAAILFSDIVLPLRAVGVDLDIVSGVGPVISSPVRTLDDVERLRPLVADDVGYITSAVQALARELGPTPLIGFAGAPFTLASYLVEGGPSRDLLKTKALMYGDPDLWHALLERLADISTSFLSIQAAAGASALQLFDSWAGALGPADYRRFVLPHSRAVFHRTAGLGVPRIHFGVITGELLASMAQAGPEVVGVDWRVPLDVALDRIGPGRAVQGNLDPALVLAPTSVMEDAAADVLHRGRSAPGHIFNLGHGVLPSTDPGKLAHLVGFVHDRSRREPGSSERGRD
jgi:uroporphyrinogen decarboxylase